MNYTRGMLGSDAGAAVAVEGIDSAGNIFTALINKSRDTSLAKSAERIAALNASSAGGSESSTIGGISTTTMILIGAGALVLLLGAGVMLTRK